jgi:hypothetical protein
VVPTGSLLAFAVTAFALIVVPGPSSRGVALGGRAALATVFGTAAGYTRAWRGRSPQRLDALGGIGGAVMIGPGVRRALVGRRD